MRKFITIVLVLVSLFLFKDVQAAGHPDFNVALSANKTSAAADGSDSITLSVSFSMYRCSVEGPGVYWGCGSENDPSGCPSYCTEKTGSSDYEKSPTSIGPGQSIVVTLSGDDITVDGSNPFNLTDATSSVNKEIRSSSAGSKTITASSYYSTWPSDVYTSTITVNFTPAESSDQTDSNGENTVNEDNPSDQSTEDNSQPSQTEQQLDLLIQSLSLQSSGKSIDPNSNPTFSSDEKISLEGKATADSKIIMTIFSDPITKEVTVDKDGNWKYVLDIKSLSLAPGAHIVKAYAQDTDGNKSSEKEILKFNVSKAKELADVSKSNKNMIPIYIGIAVGIIVVGGGIFLFFYFKKKRKNQQNSPTNIQTP